MNNRIQLAADMGELTAARHLEIPLQGPGRVNLLVCVAGITLRGFDTDDDFGTERLSDFEMFVDTEYQLRDDDVLVNSAAFATLAAIGTDDHKGMQLSLDESFAEMRTSRIVRLRLTGQAGGDTALYRVAYQIHLLVIRAR